VRPRRPDQAHRGWRSCAGNLAPEGCVVKLSGHDARHHRRPARVFECEETRWRR
jgi:dihydroxy-acid dehydratase